MAKNYYTTEEIVLCTYIAMYGRGLLIEKKVASLGKRSESSIILKVQNIAAMLDEKGIERSSDISKLTGKPTGEAGRETDWDLVQDLVQLSKDELWSQCKEILKTHKN